MHAAVPFRRLGLDRVFLHVDLFVRFLLLCATSLLFIEEIFEVHEYRS